ncbi:MAG: SHOCT domain-containing protein [Deltaproteobacteria bacterium]|nr:SHOCT domain-containing protein [Deltaproteobacteria bacterium]
MVESAFRGFFESPAELVVAKDEPRGPRADSLIRKHILWASGAGLIPIPLADIAAVTAVQVSMLRDLTKLYRSELSDAVLENFVTALTGSLLARLGASAFKAIPGIGTLLGGASMSIMSGASTYAVGRVAKNHLERVGSLANVDLTSAKREYSAAYEAGKEYVEHLEEDDADTVTKLERLGALRAKGVLTEEEFQEQKTQLLKK